MTPNWVAGIIGLSLVAFLTAWLRLPFWVTYPLALIVMVVIWAWSDILFGPYRPW